MTAVTLAKWEGIILIGGFVCVVVWKLATREISLDYLLYGDAKANRGADEQTFFSSGRAQMLLHNLWH